ncbi:TPA: capsule biosynthesis GfcC D2 domain-containing protein [Citrobacter freundii]
MKNLIHLLTGAGLCLLSANASCNGVVTVHEQGKQWRIEQVENLSQLVTQPQFTNAWWSGAAIATPAATAQIQQQKKQVLAELSAWEKRADSEQAVAIQAVRKQLESLQIIGRQFVSLDPDVVRTEANGNPRLAGNYDLWLPPESHTVTLMGAITRPQVLTWRPGLSIREYLQGEQRLAGADKDNAIVIYPDGSTVTAPVAYWNARHIEAVPGSLIWTGFSSWTLPGEFADLNERIISLLARRIPE